MYLRDADLISFFEANKGKNSKKFTKIDKTVEVNIYIFSETWYISRKFSRKM